MAVTPAFTTARTECHRVLARTTEFSKTSFRTLTPLGNFHDSSGAMQEAPSTLQQLYTNDLAHAPRGWTKVLGCDRDA